MSIWTRPGALALALSLAFAAAAPAAAGQRSHDTDLDETVSAGTTVEVDSLLGSIVATRAAGDRATIHARVTSRDDDPARVKIVATRTPGRVLICAVYSGDDEHDCRHAGHHGDRSDDITVDFTLTVPAGVRLVATTINGDVRATGLHGDVKVTTVHGDVTLENTGRAEAATVDGSLDVRLSETDWTGEDHFRTVNGPIHVTLARGSNVTLDAETLNGAIRGERGFPLVTHDGEYVGHTAKATLGKGGSRLSLHTVNGEIAVGLD